MKHWIRLCCTAALSGIVVAACSGAKPGTINDVPTSLDGSTVDKGSADGGGGDPLGGEEDATFGSGGNADATPASTGDGSLYNDASLAAGDACTTAGDAGPAPFPQRCAPATIDECSGTTDQSLTAMGVAAAHLNSATGNGFDDDCDGLVDEGCKCPSNGQTKSCYLVPATQAEASTGKPVGWCTENSKGSLDCAGAEFPKWSGTCRGAQPPYRHDVCAIGDFNCDGLQENSDVQDCTCKVEVVQCPTAPITMAPYPPPGSIPIIDGSQWMMNPASRANATNWTWTIVGGDCDNVLPHPTFAMYNASTAAPGARKGVRTGVKYDMTMSPARYVAAASEPLIGIRADNYGNGAAGGQVHPAFGLSGDYIVQGEWDLQGTHHVCTQKVQVRAPGIRAELCWDTVGNTTGNDIDLHFARLQGVSCTTKGWDTTCKSGETYQDCWYSGVSGCRDSSSVGPGWGYSDSPDAACVGWSSRRHSKDISFAQGCTNPRLDKDNVLCDPALVDPTEGEFCGPENINLDNPHDGDKFVVGVNHFGNHGGTSDAKSHVNLYCNGERVLSAGYNPVGGQSGFPVLKKSGSDFSGDIWTAATITAHVTGSQLSSCTVSPIPSHHADPTRDGPAAQPAPNDTAQACVDSQTNATPSPNQFNYATHAFIDHAALQGGADGGIPATAAGFCKH